MRLLLYVEGCVPPSYLGADVEIVLTYIFNMLQNIPFFINAHNTVGSKIIRELELSRVKISYLMHFYEINICQVMTFRLYIVYKKHAMKKTCSQIREKSQVLSQVLE